MTFFARPNLEDLQFRQLSGSTLTLEGTTKIASPTGLQLFSGGTGSIAVAADSSMPITHGMVLAYDSTVNRIRLMDISGGTGTNQYLGASPASITLGGIQEGTELTGKTISEILEELLVPATLADVTEPSILLSTTPNPFSSIYEVGSELPITANISFDDGEVAPVYDSSGNEVSPSGPRSGPATGYTFSGNIINTGQSTINITHTVLLGSNVLTASVDYSSGQTVYNSCGGVQLPALSSGSLSTTRSFNGIYPWFYGKVASGGAPSGSNRPTATASLVTGGTKVVGSSNSTISVNFNSTSDDYIWFAIPQTSTSKTSWFVNALNNGAIGGVVNPGGNLFPDFDLVTGVTTSLWSNQTYKVYISNYQSAATQIMQLRN